MPTPTYIPQVKLEIDGRSASPKLMEDVLQVSVEESLHLPSLFTLIISNPALPGRSDQEMWQHDRLFTIGGKVRIGFVNSTTRSNEFDDQKEGWIFSGEITAIETHFTSGSQAPIIVRGYDLSHRLHRGYHNQSFQKMTDSEIVKKVIAEVGIPSGTIESTNTNHEYVFQENQTHMEFLRERAARNGFELFVQDGKLHFRKPKQDASLELKWLKDLTSFQVRVSSAEQVSEVEVRGWDYKQKRPIVGSCNQQPILTKNEYGEGRKASSAFGGGASSSKLVVVDQPTSTVEEAQKIARALFTELSGEFVNADAQAQGNPEVRPGKVVTLKEMGKYSGKYYITETQHVYSEGNYKTAFSVRGLRGGDLLSLLSPATRFQPGQTLLIGVVTNNSDPEDLGRVRVKFPTLTESHESHWARVVAIGAGKERGFDCLPEIDDEVLVGFEHGDIHRPFVIGGLWNGKDKAPEKVGESVSGGKVRLRTFKTRTGHKLQFVEEDKGTKAGVYIQTTKGHHIRINDSDKFVEIETTGGHKIRLDDSSKTVSMTSTGDVAVKSGTSGTVNKIALNAGEIALTATQKITLTVGPSTIEVTPGGIKVQSPAMVDIQGTTTSVKGTAVVNVQGALVKLN